MTYTVRKASASDVGQLVSMFDEIDEYYGGSTADTKELRTARIASAVGECSSFYVAVATADDGSLAGMASCSFRWPAEGSNSSLYMKELYVRELHRRRGVGRLLFGHVCEVARQADCTRVEWTAESGDEVAAAFYASVEDCSPVVSKVFYRNLL